MFTAGVTGDKGEPSGAQGGAGKDALSSVSATSSLWALLGGLGPLTAIVCDGKFPRRAGSPKHRTDTPGLSPAGVDEGAAPGAG